MSALDAILEGLPDVVPAADATASPAAVDYRARLIDGASFVLDTPTTPPALWGDGTEVLWAEGEPLLIVGPTGVGKSTIAGQIVRGRLGLADSLLGFPITPGRCRVLYLAMDRPRQIARNLARMFTAAERATLSDRLVVHKGPPPADLGRHPNTLVDLAVVAGADTVVIDSLKDAAIKLTDDETAGNVNRAMQEAVSNGIEVLGLHHQRKGTNGNKPNSLEDVYGSTWLTAGAGSVVLLWGAAGDPLVELHHLKQPADVIGPLKVEHHLDGTSTRYAGFDPLQFLRNRANGATSTDAARAMTEKADPNPNECTKARRLLDRLVEKGLAVKEAAQIGGASDGGKGSTGARYRATDARVAELL